MYPAVIYPNRPRSNYVLPLLIAAPFIAFAAYIAWNIVPMIVNEIVPVVAQAVATSN
jgi:hypothetical protein